jgi:preprotein translocase subunit YajC
MKRFLTSTAAAIALVAVPASAANAHQQAGAVLRVDRAHHRVEIVDSQHAVRSYAAPRRATRRLRAATKLTFHANGARITSLRAKGRTRKLVFYATVVSKGSAAALFRLGDGRELRLAGRARGHHKRSHRSSVRINVQGLSAGQLVLITEAFDRRGNLTITFKRVPAPDPDGDDEDQEVTGTITAIDEASLTIQTGDGRSMTFDASTDVLEDFDVGDEVEVTYFTDADGTFVADDIEPAGNGDDPGSDELDASGTVTAIAASSISVQVDGGGAMTFQADADLLDGFGVGDRVDVTYFEGDDGSLIADDIEPLDDSGDDPSPDPAPEGD